MRGRVGAQITMLAFMDLEERVPPGHPPRTIKRLTDGALRELSPTFDSTYAADGAAPSTRGPPAIPAMR